MWAIGSRKAKAAPVPARLQDFKSSIPGVGVPRGTIKSRTHYALHALRRALDEIGGLAGSQPRRPDMTSDGATR